MGIFLAVVSPAANTLSGEGWRSAGELGLAMLLSAGIGLEREVRQKDAGLRTHTLVGVGAALFMLISRYGFTSRPCWPATSTPSTSSRQPRRASRVPILAAAVPSPVGPVTAGVVTGVVTDAVGGGQVAGR
jgi:uncharacterized membrane protein YhiD involved in acid resistance